MLERWYFGDYAIRERENNVESITYRHNDRLGSATLVTGPGPIVEPHPNVAPLIPFSKPLMMHSDRACLESLFEPWIGTADDDQIVLKYAQFDPNDRLRVISAAQTDLLPYFFALPSAQRHAIAAALVGAQSASSAELERFWEGMLPPFSLPKRHQDLFSWISEALVLRAD